VSKFTTFKRYGDSLVSSPNVLKGEVFKDQEIKDAEAIARDLARQRGIRLPSLVDHEMLEDSLKLINTTDPANGDSTGFGQHDDAVKQETVVKNKGIRKIGG
jgi:hypothetical protein